MSSRQNNKPTADQRMWPHFAQGWTGNEADPIVCADCGEDAYVGRSPRDPAAANVAHLDPADQTWTTVAVTCRECNEAHGKRPQPHLTPAVRTPDAVAASVEWVRADRAARGAEARRRAAARAARWG